MSTRCYFGVEREDGAVEAVYIHWGDGPKESAEDLKRGGYTTCEKVEELIQRGNASAINLNPQWHRVYGEPAETFASADDYVERFRGDIGIEYLYLFRWKTKAWECMVANSCDPTDARRQFKAWEPLATEDDKMKDALRIFMERIGDAVEEHNPGRVCVSKTGNYDVGIEMDGPDDALFYSNVGDYELTIPTFEEIAALPITCVKFVGDANFESEYKSLRINRRAGAGTLLVVLNADWRRDLLGVDYVDVEKRSPKEMFAETIDGVKVWVNRELRKEHLNKLLDASGGLPENGWWLADFDGNAFYVYWREPDNSLRMRTFSFDTFFECFPEDLIEEVDYE